MAHAYETFAQRGYRVSGSLAASEGGPVGIRRVEDSKGNEVATNDVRKVRVLPEDVANQTTALMTGVVNAGTGKRAAVPGFVVAGKTGTTENYGDAWFVGFTEKYTIAVWVGYADKLRPMKTEYAGQEVAGGTFPADIFRTFLTSVKAIDEQREAEKAAKEGKEPPAETTETLPAVPSAPVQTPATTPSEVPSDASGGGSSGGGGAATGGGGGGEAQPAPAPEPAEPEGGEAATGGAEAPPG
jgi:penicillin-binding protein 1A